MGEQTLNGSYVGSCVPVRDIPRFAAMMQAGKLPIEKLMTHRITLDEINEGFERLATGEAIRQVVVCFSQRHAGLRGAGAPARLEWRWTLRTSLLKHSVCLLEI